jgi:hypothetical protein
MMNIGLCRHISPPIRFWAIDARHRRLQKIALERSAAR